MAEPRPLAPQPEARPLGVQPEPDTDEVREAVGLFSDAHAMELGIQDLLTQGFSHADISVLGGERAIREKLGHRLEDTVSAADERDVPRRNYVEPESRMEGRGALASMLGYFGAVTALGLTFATGGAAAVAIGAALAGAGAGAGLGIGLGRIYDRRLAHEFEGQVQKGGILVWVRVRDQDCERRACDILARNGAHHVHAHGVAS
ncbi:MAG: hypothetical protein ACM33T_07385 [Solirubrobacterales bacterium]